MKKNIKLLCALALFTAAPTMLTACGEDPVVVEHTKMVDDALAELQVPATVEDNLSLPVSARGGVTISWVSDNDAIKIAEGGKTVTVTQSETADVVVKLTATATKDSVTKTREFTVTVKQVTYDFQLTSISDVLKAAIGTEVYVKGVVVQMICSSSSYTTPGAFYIASTDGALYCYGATTASKVAVGDNVILKGTTANYPTTLTYTTQLTNLELVKTIAKGVETPAMDHSAFETKTVADIMSVTEDGFQGKVFHITNARLNVYTTDTYTSMKLYDWEDTFDHTKASLNLYSGQGNVGMPEYDWVKPYADKKVDVLFVINSKNSSDKWRGSIISIKEM